ncbi:hypothetical protein CPB85DRAFT_1458963 [Mucidula mucida]|nr:hypothetical protein CPB85DRAFT_1458963 [Mucidula mucida]
MLPSKLALFITPSVFAVRVYALPVNCTTAAATSETDIDDLRSLYDIVWGCLATIFACTWLAVHPNVPNERIRTRGAFCITLQRVKLAGLAIIAPEVILIWAMRQWRIAQKVKCLQDLKRIVGHSLTMTHGFMLSMGGFVDASGRLIYKVSHLHCEDLPSKDELQDRSKNDALAKLIIVLQTLWFVIGCILRGVRALDISQLEVLTLAFASLNAVTYAVWWHKPMDVTVPIRLSYSYTDSAGSSVVTLVDRLPDAAERAPLNTSDYVFTSSSTLAEDVMSQTAQLGLHGALTTGECDSTTTPLPFVHLEEMSEDITDCRLNPWLETEQYDRQVTDYSSIQTTDYPASQSRHPAVGLSRRRG